MHAPDMVNRPFLGLLFPILMAFVLGGCTVMQAAKARIEPRDQFMETSLHPQVRFYPGSEAMALRIAKAMDASVSKVEQLHGKKFLEPPKVYVCDADCFFRFSSLHPNVPAGHFMDSVFMNDPELRRKEQQFGMAPENFLIHELTHLMFYQYAGGISYMRTPAWFREGWAVVVSNGAGAQACSPDEAAKHLLADLNFDPSEEGSLFSNRTASSYGLRYPVFYRQAEMFVGYLQKLDQTAFQTALHELFMGNDFQNSFEQAYGRPIASYWPGFKQSIQTLIGENQVPR